MVGSWCPPNSEVHGLALHGRAVRSFFSFQWSVISFSKKLPARLIAFTLYLLRFYFVRIEYFSILDAKVCPKTDY